ncbi:unnamed protein product [Rhizophagus irregularis]|uniref:Uncharacterized protein n=1 Tax=Rhizophagus irregularis TaxID=588596 RepID=A0A2I1GV46_9GLOM|nr:hypothetical protein RhiirA4_467005 [Rhizophagus irregularis]CAB4412570.1 unnamed protein product [Rhizophagus irregularis]CAB4413154.1 unnamed protein product [Rhizophagus irregularis]
MIRKYESTLSITFPKNKNAVQNQVTILHDCQNIIKFYGITCDGNKWYSVTEWAEYGNLRDFYTSQLRNDTVTLNDTAKLANFQSCRTSRVATFTSPEFKRNEYLERLWDPALEIAEEKAPYRNCVDIVRLTSLVRENIENHFQKIARYQKNSNIYQLMPLITTLNLG